MSNNLIPQAKVKEIFMNLPAILELNQDLRELLDDGLDLIECFESKVNNQSFN